MGAKSTISLNMRGNPIKVDNALQLHEQAQEENDDIDLVLEVVVGETPPPLNMG
jgi:hypothetical protein